jgi:O-antigen/teichoic acid export membrane protein
MFSRIGPELRGIRARARPVIARVGLAVADQAVIGIGGLLFSVLLARWVAADEFGAFMVAFAIYLLAQNVCDAAVIEPLAVYGAGKHAGRFHVYLGRLLVGFLLVSLVLAMLLAAGAGVVWWTDLTSMPVAWGLAGAAATLPLLLVRGLMRQPLYAISQQGWSIVGGVVYTVVALAALYGLHRGGVLDAATAFAALGLGGLGSAVSGFIVLRPAWRGRHRQPGLAEVARDHWDYARWSVSERLLSWIPANAYYLLAPMVLSLAASGALRAVHILLLPFFMTFAALTPMVLPWFSRTFARGGAARLDREVRTVTLALLIAALAYGLPLVLFGETVFSILFQGRFDAFVSRLLMAAAALQMIVYAATLAYDLGLRAMGSVKFACLSRILPAAMTLTLGVALLFELGIVGIFVGNALTAVAMLLVLRRAYRRELDRQPGAAVGQRIAPSRLPTVGRPVARARAVKMRSVA